ncbi:MAG: TetR-like C-terminal domain-containing protein [bacterium]|nr:TetR-like C-terminal domain-containing protein [bacterium]
MARTTKRILADSLKRLLSKKTLDRITVKEIVENCNVNRQTFYYNFQDIYDLMEWLFQDDLENALENKKSFGNWQDGINVIFNYMSANKSFVLNAFNSLSRPALEKYLKKCVRPDIEGIVDSQIQNLHITEEDKDFIINMYVMAIIGIVFDWIDNDMDSEYSKHLEQLKKLINGSLKYIIDKFAI